MYVYFGDNKLDIRKWDGNGRVSFRQGYPSFEFQNGTALELGLKWYEVYCLTILGTYFARYNNKEDTYTWRKTASEPFPVDKIVLPGSLVRLYQPDVASLTGSSN